ncbi:MAG: ABC transporter ATP-binding protein [Fimbriiglobus sp.]
MMAKLGLSLENIAVRYGTRQAVDGVSVAAGRGEIVGLLGPNGSGKSTTLAVAAGLLEPRSGKVFVDGILQRDFPTLYAQRIGLVPQEPALYEELSAQANLQFFGKLYGLSSKILQERIDKALEHAGLQDRRNCRVSTFSGGMRQRLNLAAALLHEPTVLLLDEPTAALDPASRDRLFNCLHDLRERGHAILLTTHHLDEVEYGCDRIVLLDSGRVVASGRPAELIRYQPGDRAVIYAQVSEVLPVFFQKSLAKRVPADVELEFTARRLRISAGSQELMGQALAVILADGIHLETFRTPPGRLERMLRHPTTELANTEVPTATS